MKPPFYRGTAGRHDFTVTVGTLFADTRLPLSLWFEAMWYVVNQKSGASALGVQRVLGVSYLTAWCWLHKLRRAMVRLGRDRLAGTVEVDEVYVGGEMVDKFNDVAAKIMKENGVLIDDLNAECRRMGKPKALNVHDVGNLAPKVTEVVKAALAARKNPSRPLPRVLFIGDFITGTYWEKVKQNLDGIAFVAKNPGNGEHSGTGARLVNQWVDLKQYLLNGQEYLELVSGVKQTLADINRYCPDFAGRTPELAGIVWFQGIADAQSDAFTAAYEKNLTGLIQDLRAEFKQPKLPFVVVALGQYGDKMSPNARKVHAAQMAVGDSAKHPEFKGNVASVDTLPFFFPKEKSLGGREWDYHNNAESFLLIGEAMGNEMLRLMK